MLTWYNSISGHAFSARFSTVSSMTNPASPSRPLMTRVSSMFSPKTAYCRIRPRSQNSILVALPFAAAANVPRRYMR